MVLVSFFAVLFFSLFIYLVLFYSGVQVKNIFVFGNQDIASKDITDLIYPSVSRKILAVGNWEVSSRSIFFVDSKKLVQEILYKFPSVTSAKISKQFPQTLDIEILERTPVGIFCQNLNDCFMIDRNGIIFKKISPDFSNNQYLVLKKPDSVKESSIGENVISGNNMNYVMKVQKDLEDNCQTNIKEALIFASQKLDIGTDQGWRIYFDLGPNADLDSQILKLNRLLSGEISPDKRSNLKYIDLRPKDRAIICDNKLCGG